jgi:hypothetical protein
VLLLRRLQQFLVGDDAIPVPVDLVEMLLINPFASSLLILPSRLVSRRSKMALTRSATMRPRSAFSAAGSILPFLPVSSLRSMS